MELIVKGRHIITENSDLLKSIATDQKGGREIAGLGRYYTNPK